MTNRTEMMRELAKVGRHHPDMRFGQLICMLSHHARGPARSSTYDVEDNELFAAAREHLASCPKCRGDEDQGTEPETAANPERAAAARASI